ncbi:MAG: phospholipase D family protein [Bacteroidales bacterium]|jgi:phosphatidylserine/phosphatidylglycerophosphate/cardiolipin synthase-like enzyme|nr:phospholipase D family protein [Bacteroidales bacterium]
MAKYLRTSSISAEVENLIRDAKERLYIISPYLKLSDNIKELFNDKERDKTDVRIIFGKQELNPSEMSYLQQKKYIRLYFSKNLHAKCYLNEKKMVISSMNLYEFSQVNNKEMGILIDRDDENDKNVYEDAWRDIDSILNNATDFAYIEVPKENKQEKEVAKKTTQTKPSTPKQGYCIRTGVPIPFNVEKPMSYEAYQRWAEYGNPDYPEKFCHFSGEPSNGKTSVERPILQKNWKEAQKVPGF